MISSPHWETSANMSEEVEEQSTPSPPYGLDGSVEPHFHHEEDSASSSDESESSDESDSSSDEEVTNESLADNIIREIEEGTYTCLVCTLEIDQLLKVWSCDFCYRVYDLDCILDWAKRGTSTKDRKWKCPNCYNSHSKLPRKFTCWCGKVENPQGGLIPFSCGNLCNYSYDNCIHKCTSVCHPGNHPVCGALGPKMDCKCGKHSRQLPCLITPYKTGWQCEEKCNLRLCDMGHRCAQDCHSGFCGPCDVEIEGQCYCGQETLALPCSKKFLRPSKDHIGVGYCNNKTKKYYDCGVHFDMIDCEVETPIKTCKFSAQVQKTCYCGKTSSSRPRTKCTDPILQCGLTCGKPLDCGCVCNMACHEGPCECFNVIPTKCSCKNYEYLVPCKALQAGFIPKCQKKCNVLLSCRKHYHKAECCPYEPVAMARERELKKKIRNKVISSMTNLNDVMTIESVHICTETCTRLKSCGLHECGGLCHAGPCPPCLESTNDDLICNCGKTIIPAPVRCGTKLKCEEQCVRPKACGHPTELHKCHEDGECPKCTTLVTKTCDCGREEIANVLCSGPLPKCSFTCKEKRDCGHLCMRNCSPKCKDGEHLTSATCQSQCGKVRTNCPHKCKLKCHVNKTGQSPKCDAKVCAEPVSVSCECGRLTSKVPCNSSLTQPSSIDSKLHCDEKCEQIKRDAELKDAFFKVETPSSDLIYSSYVLETFKKQSKWCRMMESFLLEFISGEKVSHHFPVMNHPQRQFIHELCAAYSIYSESQDPEPKRNVFIYKMKESTRPQRTIEEELTVLEQLEEEEARKQEELKSELFNSIFIEDIFFGGETKLETARELSDARTGETLEIVQIESKNYIVLQGEMDIEKENKLYLLNKFLKNWLRDNSVAFDCKLALVRDGQVLKLDEGKMKKDMKPFTVENGFNSFTVLEVAE